jgi:hypothetical protein
MKRKQNELSKLKLQLFIKDRKEDRLLGLLLEDSRAFILAYTGRDEAGWKPVFDSVCRELAAIAYNSLGNEGLTSIKEGAMSGTYVRDLDIPSKIIRTLKPYRRIGRGAM